MKSADWEVVGNHFVLGPEVSDALNQANIGDEAFVGLNLQQRFTVFANKNSNVQPNHQWQHVGDDPDRVTLIDEASRRGAISTTGTINTQNNWVLWAYAPTTSSS